MKFNLFIFESRDPALFAFVVSTPKSGVQHVFLELDIAMILRLILSSLF